ncbi:HTH-type transcriptional repressor YtrA [Thalassoglobus neptunius]|uniref:HTH-type transcriptional repressor YtrA n=1 Tax=Thalassoglobus neptunius TaxID=1938619 RepID=A0A5C5WPJ3_9PLAN|nr:GntR family transcriptional regulator [Thalassoglobus neptunius]TWT51933.1 HTH-type transcriptional repressor YtrA [Thalassoglobus neptunius]
MIDTNSDVPIYKQIAERIRADIAIGIYRTGEGLPSIRSLAIKLKVNQNTVHKAYGELESEGLIVQRRGLGMFVAKRAGVSAKASALKAAKEELNRGLASCIAAGMSSKEIAALLKESLSVLEKERHSGD